MNLDFNKVWASDTSPDYPSDTQAKRGLSFLGTEPPTFDLHDAIFQRLDGKALWLYDQVRVACERFGQKVQNDDGSLVSDARDIMANAITYALLNQRKADEGGYGIIKMASADQTNAGQEYNLAVSPKRLAEYVSAQNTWNNTRDKPQTATRWPSYDEVTNKPQFDAAGTAAEVKRNLESVISSTDRALSERIATNANSIDGVKNNLGTMSSQDANNVNIGGGSATFNDVVGFKSGAKIFEDQNNFAFGLRNKAGDTLYIEPGAKLAYANNEGIEKVTFVDGKMTKGEIPRDRVTGLGSMSYESSGSYEKVGVAQQIVNDLMLGSASKKAIFDTSDWTSIPWDGASVPTTSVARSLADQIRISQKNISDLNTSSVDISRILNLGKGRQGDVGYISIPYNNGNEVKYIWIMWTWWAGSVSGTATNNGMFEGSTSITWPIAFPNDCSFCIPSVNDVSGGGMQESVWLNGDSNSAYDKSGAKIMFATRMAGGARMSGNIFAIGY